MRHIVAQINFGSSIILGIIQCVPLGRSLSFQVLDILSFTTILLLNTYFVSELWRLGLFARQANMQSWVGLVPSVVLISCEACYTNVPKSLSSSDTRTRTHIQA